MNQTQVMKPSTETPLYISASFAGDSGSAPQYLACNTVSQGNDISLVVTPEYVLGALEALGACFVGFAVFKKRSSLPHFKRL